MFENYMNWLGPKIGPITLSNWNPNPTKFYIIENTNEKLKIEPQAGLEEKLERVILLYVKMLMDI